MMKVVKIGLALVIGIGIGFLVQPILSSDNIYNQLRKFDYILNTAYRNYVEEVDAEKLTEAAIKGMLNELDVHSVYISKTEMEKVNEDFQGYFHGIGVEFDIINDTIVIVAPLVGGPSEQLGILSGDKIIKIDGEDAIGISRSDVPKKLKGPKGTKVEIDVKRGNLTTLQHYKIIRDVIPIYTVSSKYMIEDSEIGYMHINRFAETTYDEMVQAAFELKEQGMKKLILDLRGNPGGYLSQAYMMADEFLRGGDTIVYTNTRKKKFDEVYVSRTGNTLENIPLIIMVDQGSASASEIVSGSIQDLDRGLVVGTTSFGKGLVQRQFKSEDGSAFRITIAKYYTPSGRSIQRPYKDKEDYRKLVGRLDLEEGNYVNIEKAMAKIKKDLETETDSKKKIDLDSLPIYKTRSGRTVLGGGGITPDYIVKGDTSTMAMLTRNLYNSRMFYEYANAYLNGSGKDFKARYKDKFSEFYNKFEIDEKLIKEFKELAEIKEIEWKDDEFKKDEDYIKLVIKSFIAKIVWDNNKQQQVMSRIDRQLNKAVTLFPEAEKMMSMK